LHHFVLKKTLCSKKVGVVGNGLLLDTRGHNTTFDYGGAAAVLGAARATAALAPSGVEAHFIVASCEVCDSSTGRGAVSMVIQNSFSFLYFFLKTNLILICVCCCCCSHIFCAMFFLFDRI